MTAHELERLAAELGLDAVGAAPAEPYEDTERHIRDRRARGLFADMRFTMARPEVSFRIQHQGERPVVHELHLHGGTEAAGGHDNALLVQASDQAIHQGLGPFRQRGIGEARTSPAAQIRVKRELAHNQQLPPSRPNVQVGPPRSVLEVTQPKRLLRHAHRDLGRIAVAHPNQDQGTGPDLTHDVPVDPDRGAPDPLDDEPHSGAGRRSG